MNLFLYELIPGSHWRPRKMAILAASKDEADEIAKGFMNRNPDTAPWSEWKQPVEIDRVNINIFYGYY